MSVSGGLGQGLLWHRSGPTVCLRWSLYLVVRLLHVVKVNLHRKRSRVWRIVVLCDTWMRCRSVAITACGWAYVRAGTCKVSPQVLIREASLVVSPGPHICTTLALLGLMWSRTLVNFADDDLVLLARGCRSPIALSTPFILDATPVTVPWLPTSCRIGRLLSPVIFQDKLVLDRRLQTITFDCFIAEFSIFGGSLACSGRRCLGRTCVAHRARGRRGIVLACSRRRRAFGCFAHCSALTFMI